MQPLKTSLEYYKAELSYLKKHSPIFQLKKEIDGDIHCYGNDRIMGARLGKS